MTATGTGGMAMPAEDDMMMPEGDDGLPPMDDGEDSELGLDDGMGDLGGDDMGMDDMGDDLGGDDMGMGESVDMDTLERVLDQCCPEQTQMVMKAVRDELGGGMDDLGGGEEIDVEVGGDGMDDLGMADDVEVDAGVDDLSECDYMESKISDIANLITEDPDIFTRPARSRRRR